MPRPTTSAVIMDGRDDFQKHQDGAAGEVDGGGGIHVIPLCLGDIFGDAQIGMFMMD